jgi:hypothetical protein
MKYLKKFNEELDKKTLLSAAKKSIKYGHFNKNIKLLSHIYLNDIKKYGSVILNIKYGEYPPHESDDFIGEFYPFINFLEDKSGKIKNNYNSENYFALEFDAYAFPKNDDSIETILKTTERTHGSDFDRFRIGQISVYYDIPDPDDDIKSEYKFGLKNIYTNFNYKVSINKRMSIINDKKSAVSLKRNILGCFEQGSQYPTMDSYKNSYEQILQFLNKSGFTLEYGYTIDDIYNDINSYSSNNFYTENQDYY